MALFLHKYPYTNMHEMNLDWLLNVVSKNKLNIESLMESVEDVIDLIGDSPLQTVAQTITAAINELKNGKQDKLTAGTNVTISDSNVISAADTKYTAGSNVSISDDNVISATGELSPEVDSTAGTITITPETADDLVRLSLNYPAGYAKGNCIPIACRRSRSSTVDAYGSGEYADVSSAASISGQLPFYVSLRENDIYVGLRYSSPESGHTIENDIEIEIEVFLLKI